MRAMLQGLLVPARRRTAFEIELHNRVTRRVVAVEPAGDTESEARALLAVVEEDLRTLSLETFGRRWGRRRPMLG